MSKLARIPAKADREVGRNVVSSPLLESDKLRGGYYTSSAVASWLCTWAIRSGTDTVLEPSCGDGAFLEAAALRLEQLGATPGRIAKQLRGVEVLGVEAEKARRRLVELLGRQGVDGVERADFFDWYRRTEGAAFQCVVGNPPFIRYQNFPEPSRTYAMALMQSLGLKPNRLTNIWVPFVVAASALLHQGGRLALVLPAELLQVTYASQLRSFLVDRFKRIDVVACNDLFFDHAEQEVVLLLADGAMARGSASNTCRVALTEARNVKEVTSVPATCLLKRAQPKPVCHDSEKWLKYFLSPREISFMRQLRVEGKAVPLSTHATVDVGVVTGKNEFFVLSQNQVEEHGLAEYATPVVGRSAHLRGARLTTAEWRTLAANGERVYLFEVPPSTNGSLSASGRQYVRLGEAKQIDQGYKCSVRSPWYAVPSVWKPDCFFFRQIYDFPRLVLNRAGATSTDTIHRLRCLCPTDAFAPSIYTHLTAASAEIEGRSYGGGVLELEPTEAERLLVPATLGHGLSIEECDQLIREGRLDRVLEQNDRLILERALGLSKRECGMLRSIWEKMRNRRMARKRRTRTE